MPEMTFHIDFAKQSDRETLEDWLEQFDLGYLEFFPAYTVDDQIMQQDYDGSEIFAGWAGCNFVWYEAPDLPFEQAVDALNARLIELGVNRPIIWEAVEDNAV